MTVAGKIATGFGVMMVLLVGVLAYDLALVRRLASANQSLSEINFRATMTALEMSRLLNQLDEFTRKLIVTRDAAYAAHTAFGSARDAHVPKKMNGRCFSQMGSRYGIISHA